jgi:hypothetical protein
MSVIEKAKAHYQAKLSAEPRPISIPEWELEAFIKPGISLERLGEIMQAANENKTAEAMVLTIVYRLIDGEGKQIFKKLDKLELLKAVDPDVLADIVNKINNSDPSTEDIEGN